MRTKHHRYCSHDAHQTAISEWQKYHSFASDNGQNSNTSCSLTYMPLPETVKLHMSQVVIIFYS